MSGPNFLHAAMLLHGIFAFALLAIITSNVLSKGAFSDVFIGAALAEALAGIYSFVRYDAGLGYWLIATAFAVLGWLLRENTAGEDT